MSTFTDEQKLTIVKHLAGGKDADLVATIMHASRADVIAVARNHGYPDTDKLSWAADVMAKNLEENPAGINTAPLAEGGVKVSETLRPVPTPAAVASPVPPVDDVLGLLNKGKGHSSKRIQSAANKALDAIAKVRTLVAEDDLRNAERRQAVKQRAEARAEVERLQKQLAAAKAKLRGEPLEAQARGALGEDGEHPCADCGRTFGSAHGLGVHVGRAHGEQAAS